MWSMTLHFVVYGKKKFNRGRGRFPDQQYITGSAILGFNHTYIKKGIFKSHSFFFPSDITGKDHVWTHRCTAFLGAPLPTAKTQICFA